MPQRRRLLMVFLIGAAVVTALLVGRPWRASKQLSELRISTGTPGGVGIAMKPPSLLKVGDVVRIEIAGIGEIENAVIDEPAETEGAGLD